VKHLKLVALVALTSAWVLAGCEKKTESVAVAPAPAASPEKPVASILDLMAGQVDPSADFLWESVATVSTPKGMIEHQPRTDEEWLAVRMKALQLAEAANLLMMPGRRLAHPGQHLDDEGAQGNLTGEQAQVAIDSNRDTFLAYAVALRDTAERTIAAIDKKDVDAFLEVGGQIDEACEQCHLKFWYPGSVTPPTAAR
jgi:hypothetical protein